MLHKNFISMSIIAFLFAFLPVSYAAAQEQIYCPPGMAMVDDTFCIDIYEYPNIKGSLPVTDVTWEYASIQCGSEDKRLCTSQEWQKACGGRDSAPYPYGKEYKPGACNDSEKQKLRSGDQQDCTGANGIYDMSGNVAEWIADDAADGGRKLQGGSFASVSPDMLACDHVSAQAADASLAHAGFRCCKGIIHTEKKKRKKQTAVPREKLGKPGQKFKMSEYGEPVIAPLIQFTPASARQGAYFLSQYQELGNIRESSTLNSQVSATGFAFTAGFTFENNVTLELTRISHNVEEMASGQWVSRRQAENVFHVSYALTRVFTQDSWPGGMVVGVRRFKNEVGHVSEAYVAKDFHHNGWSITPGVNFMSQTTRNSRVGFSLDVRYHVSPDFTFFGQYSSQDFYKNIINDYLTSRTATGVYTTCDSCPKDSFSLGMDYGMLREHGGLYFLVYDVGDLNAPMGGAYFNF